MSIDVAHDGHVAVVTINRPDARNALDPEHDRALGRAIAEIDADPEVRVGILTGAGDVAFSAGADLKTLLPPFQAQVRSGAEPPWNFGGFTAVERRTPLIAAINGHALAGGCEMALACDIRLASPNATIGLAETKWAIIPGAGGTVRLPRAVPLGAAMEMILTGEPVPAPEALRLGLVNRVVPRDQLMDAALAMARTIAARGPLAVQAARASVLNGLGRPHEEAMRFEYEQFIGVVRSDDAEEGFTAFQEKRAPRYLGR